LTTFYSGMNPSLLKPGSAKANGREPTTCLGRVFNYKLGCFESVHAFTYVDTHPHLELKTRPRFSPVSLCLSLLKDITLELLVLKVTNSLAY